jgi:steroid delta-isomerase-like uncharacterized protein
MGDARQLAEAFFDRFAAGDFEGARALFADDCISVAPTGSMDNDQHEMLGRTFKGGLPDAHMELVRAVEEGDEVILMGRFRGTHTGDLVTPEGTIPASGNSLDLPFADYFRVADGKIAAHETVWDQMTMLGQLGALPPPS